MKYMIRSKRIVGSAKIGEDIKFFSRGAGGRFAASGRSSYRNRRQKMFSYQVIDPNMVMSFGQSARALVADIGQVGAFSQPIKALIKRLVNVKQLWKANVNTLALIISLTGKFYESIIEDQVRQIGSNGLQGEPAPDITESDIEAAYEEEVLAEEETQEESDSLTERLETAAILARTFFTFLFSSVMSVIIKREMLKAGITGPVTAKEAFVIVNKTLAKMGMVRFLSSQARAYYKDLRFVFAVYVATSGSDKDLLSKPENLMRFYRGQMFYTRFIDEIVNLIVEERTSKVVAKQNSNTMRNKTYTNPILRSYYEDEDVEVYEVVDEPEEGVQYEQRLEEVQDLDEDLEAVEEVEDLEEDMLDDDYAYEQDLEQDYEDEELEGEDDEELEEIVAEIEKYEEEDDEYDEEDEDDDEYEDEDEDEDEEYLYLEEEDYIEDGEEEKLPQEMTDEEFAEAFESIEPRREAYVYASRLLARNNKFFSNRSLVNRIVEDLSRFFSEEEKEEAKESLKVVVDRAEAQELVEDLKELVAKLAELLMREEETKVAEQKVEDEDEEEETDQSPWWTEDEEESEEEVDEEKEEEETDEDEDEDEKEEEKSQSKRSYSRRGYIESLYAKKNPKRRAHMLEEDEEDVEARKAKKSKQRKQKLGLAPTRDNDAMDEVRRNLRKSKLEYQKSIRRELKERKRYMQIPDEDKYIKPSQKGKKLV